MSRRVLIGLCWLAALGATRVPAQDSNGLPPPYKPPVTKEDLPEEEDKAGAPKVYSFNPVQSKSEVSVGNEYFVKGNYTAAANRFREATRWNDGNAEAWLRLGEAEEKRSNSRAARDAYQKFLEISPNAKNAADVRKRLAKLKT